MHLENDKLNKVLKKEPPKMKIKSFLKLVAVLFPLSTFLIACGSNPPTSAPKLSPTSAPELSPTSAPELSPTSAPDQSPTSAPALSPTAPPALSTTSPPPLPTT